MDNKTRPLHRLSISDSLQIKRQTQNESKEMEEDFSWKWKQTKNLVAVFTPDKIDFKTKAITGDKEEPSNFTSGYLSEETQNTKSNRHIHSYIHYLQKPRCGSNLSIHQ